MNLPVRHILNSRFRANRDYEFVVYDQLGDEEKQYFEKAFNIGADAFGVFKPRGQNGLTLKLANKDVASLFFHLQEKETLPGYIKYSKDPEINRQIVNLVLENIIEMESGDDFISGATSYPYLYEKPSIKPAATNYLTSLSLDAVHYAALMGIQDLNLLSNSLYCYNRLPLSISWEKKLETTNSVIEYLGIVETEHQKGPNWIQKPEQKDDRWFYWRCRSQANHGKSIFKLYLSPHPDSMKNIFPLLVDTVSDTKAFSFKIGNDAYGLLRPDKIVLYFDTKEDALAAGGILKTAFNDLPVQGVPFTSQLDERGLVSWGIDPPQSPGLSWRFWITNRIAKYITDVQRNKKIPAEKVSELVLKNLEKDEINILNWELNRNFDEEYFIG